MAARGRSDANIAQTLEHAGLTVETCDAADDDVLSGPGALVLGSPLSMGKWLKPARLLADRLALEPQERRMWFFTVGPLGDPPEPADASPEEELLELIRTRGEGHEVFRGKLDRSQVKLRERIAANAVKAPDGDLRD